MVYICTATYWEAKPVIQELKLKKEKTFNIFQIFKDDNTILIITGTGKIKASIAITYLFSHFKPTSKDILINIGICGTLNKNFSIGETFIINKIIDNDTKRTFYPDMIFKFPFKECSLETYSLVYKNNNLKSENKLVDMEGAGVYEAASIFLQQHQIYLIKIISDYCNNDIIDYKKLEIIVKDSFIKLFDFVLKINQELFEPNILNDYEIEQINELSEIMKLSVTMKYQLTQLLKYKKLIDGEIISIINKYKKLSYKTKREGKKYFEELRRKII